METVPNYPYLSEGSRDRVLTSDTYTVIGDREKAPGYDEWKTAQTLHSSAQTESQLERELIRVLRAQGYEYLPRLTDEAALIRNLREQLERLNTRPEEGAYGPNSGFHFSDEEFDRLLNRHIARYNDGILEKAKLIQEERRINFYLDDGTPRNIILIDAVNPARNRMQVINQYRVPDDQGKTLNRYDVTILINGLPLVHIELKRRSISIRRAFQQIERYQGEGFQQDTYRLFEYAQIFIISNGVDTKYYSNTVRHKHIEDQRKASRKVASGGSAGKSFEFTSYWADSKNNRIGDLMLFARTFLNKRTIANILTRYCILTVDEDLLVMRPYQIAATERIINRVEIANNDPKRLGTKEAGGYIWHTTGSGKTLTSFKTARRLAETGLVEKVIFVVDRKDLDYQTMLEYNNFQADSVSSTGSTRELGERLADSGTGIVVTTIHKLSNLISAEPKHPVYRQRVVIIFDECHRSQFGAMHRSIRKRFTKYSMFGFTGTPIFDENSAGGPGTTTVEIFGDRLHSYTVVDAINDKNVLPFHMEYTITNATYSDEEKSAYQLECIMEGSEQPNPKDIEKYLQSKEALENPQRIEAIATYILDNYDRKTNQRAGRNYDLKRIRDITDPVTGAKSREPYTVTVRGFNSILATSSIDAACTYYDTINTLQEERIADGVLDPAKKLKVAIIYTQGNGSQLFDTFGEEENYEFPTAGSAEQNRMAGFLEDYNTMFSTNFSADGKSFDNYYKDVSRRMKTRELDMLIVVNMFLTGFDSKTVNTLWVDKNLKSHGLVQAFSRTNRILNSLKPSGNIVCFRDLEEATNDAFALYGDYTAGANAGSGLETPWNIVLTRPYKEAHIEYCKVVDELREEFPVDAGGNIIADTPEQKVRYVELINQVLTLQNELEVFDEFIRDGSAQLISDYDMQGYLGKYNDIREEAREARDYDGELTNPDGGDELGPDPWYDQITFEVELLKQQNMDVYFILELVAKARAERDNARDQKESQEYTERRIEEFRKIVHRAVRSDNELRNSGDIIEDYFEKYLTEPTVDAEGLEDVHERFRIYVTERRVSEEDFIVQEEELKREETRRVVNRALREGNRSIIGKVSRLIKSKMSFFGGALGGPDLEDAAVKRQRVQNKLEKHIGRFMPFLGGR